MKKMKNRRNTLAEYRRFVAYVYEYNKGKKGNNCGFVKVEAKQTRCMMELHLQCPGLAAEVPCKIYGFVRKDGLLNGVYLGECRTGEGKVECTLESDPRNMGNSGMGLDKMGGMIFCTELGAFFGTEWDDKPIRPDNFKEYEKAVLKPSAREEQTDSGISEERKKETDSEEKGNLKEEKEPETFEEEEAPEASEAKEEPEEQTGDPENTPEVEAEEVGEEGKEACAPPRTDPGWGREPGEPCMPFEDGEMGQCWKIHPRDACRLFQRDGSLRNNRFLFHGYYNFGHLLLCRKEDGQYILGVPGGYDQQERFMANMFGFPYFKESRQVELAQAKGGYWYRFMGKSSLGTCPVRN